MNKMLERAFLHPGDPLAMGATCREGGVNFAVFSDHATRVELCIFDSEGTLELDRRTLFGPEHGVFHGFMPNVGAGLVYGYRAWGPTDRNAGHCFNPETILLDPYAREILHLHLPSHQSAAPGVSFRGRVSAPRVSTQNSRSEIKSTLTPIKVEQRVLYEVHVKGFSQLREQVPEALRGKYLGLSHASSVAHFKALGVTTLSILPVFAWLDEHGVALRGMVNYWGYNTLGFFCPSPRYAVDASDPTTVRAEFCQMVDELHAAGLEVVLDVVYNHTAEAGIGRDSGNSPASDRSFSFRGLDNTSWYRGGGEPWCDQNYTGCGNALNFQHPRVRQFVLDSMRYWAEEIGVDGFRFDLAPIHGRMQEHFSSDAPFFHELNTDPVLSKKLMIAEPWDVGPSGYQVGRFPKPFLEWNDQFRDTVRSFWIGSQVNRGQFAARFAASSDLFQKNDRSPMTSINFISVHDGFTLRDMLSYSTKHNHANGENNRDGRDNELCNNCGIEGATDNLTIVQRRLALSRAFLGTLLLAQGTPMLHAGDEIGRTQRGNNNAYCIDNELTWLDWSVNTSPLSDWISGLLALRRSLPIINYGDWFADAASTDAPALLWFDKSACSLSVNDWQDSTQLSLAVCYVPKESEPRATHLLVIFNADLVDQNFSLPPSTRGDDVDSRWYVIADSSNGKVASPDEFLYATSSKVLCPARSMLVLRGA